MFQMTMKTIRTPWSKSSNVLLKMKVRLDQESGKYTLIYCTTSTTLGCHWFPTVTLYSLWCSCEAQILKAFLIVQRSSLSYDWMIACGAMMRILSYGLKPLLYSLLSTSQHGGLQGDAGEPECLCSARPQVRLKVHVTIQYNTLYVITWNIHT